ncbi:MAG: YfhO family protein, partial [Proteobacteria bacterium]|nr:YfhO family protein [Pseudomonadota bacterium]
PAANAVLQAVVVALLMLGTNPQLAVYSLAIYLAWSLWRSWEKSSRTPVLSALAATALGAGLSCLRYVPFYFAMKAQGGPALAYDVFRSRYLTEPGHLLRLFTPEIFGARLHLEVEGGINHFEIFSAYVGVPCALAALFILISCWNRRTAFFNLLTLAILLILLGTPLLYVHYYGLAKMEIMYNRLAWFLPLGFGALFAVGAEEVFLHRKKPFFAFSVGVLALVAALAWLLVSRSFTPEFREAVRPEIRFSLLHFLALGLASLLVFSLAGKRVLFKALLTVLVLADLLAVASIESNNSHPFFSPMPLFRFCDEAKMVAEKMERERHPHRILSVPWLSRTNPRGPYTPNNQYLALGLYNSSGYDNQSPRLLSQLYRHPGEGGRVLDRQILPFTDRMVRLSSSGYCTDGARVWVHEDALKRWGLYTKYEVRAPGAETLDLLVSSEFSWPGTLVLDQEPDLPIRPRAGPGGFTILEQGRNRLAVQVAAPENALFLVNDSRDPGWTAVQDGRPAPILAANHAFMALEVPAGVHTLEMSFTPQGWRAGLAVSLFAILALAATAFAAFRPRRLPAKISWEFASTPPSL